MHAFTTLCDINPLLLQSQYSVTHPNPHPNIHQTEASSTYSALGTKEEVDGHYLPLQHENRKIMSIGEEYDTLDRNRVVCCSIIDLIIAVL